MATLQLAPFDPAWAPVVAGWATTVEDVSAWCSRSEAPVPPDVIVGWGEADGVLPYAFLRDTDLVGYGELWVDDEEREVELGRVIVAPAHRGRGVGRAFVTELTSAARNHYPQVFLRVQPDNVAAQRCYAAAGFTRASPEQEAEWNRIQPTPYLWMIG